MHPPRGEPRPPPAARRARSAGARAGSLASSRSREASGWLRGRRRDTGPRAAHLTAGEPYPIKSQLAFAAEEPGRRCYWSPDKAAAGDSKACRTGVPAQSEGSDNPSIHSTVEAVSMVRTDEEASAPFFTPRPQAIQGIVTSRGSDEPWFVPWPPWSAVTMSE